MAISNVLFLDGITGYWCWITDAYPSERITYVEGFPFRLSAMLTPEFLDWIIYLWVLLCDL